jgi:preprotein translocase subunit SecE
MRTSTITIVVVSVFVAGLAFGADKRFTVTARK